MQLLLAQNITTDSIYSNMPLPLQGGSTIVLQEKYTEYQLNITSNISLTIDTANLTEFLKYACEFTLYINSDADHVINFQDCNIQQLEVWSGRTILHFKHLIGMATWQVEVVQFGKKMPEFIYVPSGYNMPYGGTSYGAQYSKHTCTLGFVTNFGWTTITSPTSINSNNEKWTWNATPVELYTSFPSPVMLTEFRMHLGSNLTYNFPTGLTVYGSNDNQNWNEVFAVSDLTYTVSQEIKKFNPTVYRPYRCYKWVFTNSLTTMDIMPISLTGIKCSSLGGLSFYRYPKIAGATGGCSLSVNTEDGITQTKSVYFCVNTQQSGGYTELNRSSSNVPFIITYTLPQAVKFEGFCAVAYSSNKAYFPNGHMKWEGSNDGTTWTRLCEVTQPFDNYWVDGMYVYYMLHTLGEYSYFRATIYTVWEQWQNKLMVGGLVPIYTVPEEYRTFDTVVPLMESDTQNGYTVSSSSTTVGATYLMYDGDDTTYGGGAIENGQWITNIDMGESIVIQGIELQAASNNYSKMPITFSVQGSTDNNTWQSLQSYVLGAIGWVENGQVQSFSLDNLNSYRYYRIVVTATQEGGTDVRISGIGWSAVAGQRPIDYFTEDYLVPKMSQNSQDGYVASAQTYYNNDYAPWIAFNRTATSLTDCWVTAQSEASDSSYNVNTWLQIQLPQAAVANSVTMVGRVGNSSEYLKTPRDWKLQGSNDGSTWTDLVTVTNQIPDSSGQAFTYEFENTTAYLYYRAAITRISLANQKASVSQLNITYRTYYDN